MKDENARCGACSLLSAIPPCASAASASDRSPSNASLSANGATSPLLRCRLFFVEVIVMLVPNHPIFRNNAVKHYMQSRDKDSLPRFISLPIALFLWILLGLLLVVGGLAWYEQIPSYVSGNGVVLNATSASR